MLKLFAERAIDDLVAGRQQRVLLGRALGIVGLGFGGVVGEFGIVGRSLSKRASAWSCAGSTVASSVALDGVSAAVRYVFVDDGDFEAGRQEAGLTHAVDELFVWSWRFC